MPFIIFLSDKGERLDVLSSHPMIIWTTNRESQETNLFLKNRADYRDLFHAAYVDSQKEKNTYPIDSWWEYSHGNKKIVPLFWVFDRSTGFWDNIGYRFLSEKYGDPYNIQVPFYTVLDSKK